MHVDELDILGFCHLGVVVRDLDDFFGTWGRLLGVGDAVRVDSEQAAGDHQLHGTVIDEPTSSRLAFFTFHGTAIEVIQPLGGRAASSRWLADHGPGVNHVAFWVRDLASALSRLGDEVEVTYSPVGLTPHQRPATAVLPPSDASTPFWAYVEPWSNPTGVAVELLDAGLAGEFRRRFGPHAFYPGDLPNIGS